MRCSSAWRRRQGGGERGEGATTRSRRWTVDRSPFTNATSRRCSLTLQSSRVARGLRFGRIERTITTDEFGVFRFFELPGGAVALTVRHVGFTPGTLALSEGRSSATP